ncbi:FKBP-type peptidyl-prolyl cis-trans isomerase [Campylobacter geochelonis]|uniref:Peptidyl-prolyl cis-trans isomerase n=1 Tax=Campylobacter geochelonis TaxID=1780362 RepID=A0A128ED99_9BACT|nr:peptidylprolyl isomerase [Campylobacter geochelonis]QKF70707.1 FKBP-type peptidyl-prolyl cis-trans isomerase [Campylobacter geochelonis]CZE45750.1 fkbp-type peptidyl-prolyl cis-trans isomerase slyd [Campylobacter geochelonis]CZE46899.1 fkbp-type peptidyl-prolyl cis-trans isomerase slyd [Campylobacter geochelonis]CZE50248.1 fkbp-type peptidyl-prolyl cis-trans isomerase slyd [Campylobacter geochelonis]
MANNRVITMFYELKDANSGELLETNWDKEPISFVTGLGQILQKLEDDVVNLENNDEKTIKIEAKEGIGEYNNEAVQSLPKEQFAGIELVEGMELFGQGEDGSTARVIVKAIGDEEVMIDFNHPYAGKDLEFKVKIVENREADADEAASGVVAGAASCACGNGGGHHHGEEGGCCGGHGHHSDEDECCGGEHHGQNGGCCGKHKA